MISDRDGEMWLMTSLRTRKEKLQSKILIVS